MSLIEAHVFGENDILVLFWDIIGKVLSFSGKHSRNEHSMFIYDNTVTSDR